MVLVFMVTMLVAGFGLLYVMQNKPVTLTPIEECIANISPDVDPVEWQFQWQECQLGVRP